eukprot:g6893.t2
MWVFTPGRIWRLPPEERPQALKEWFHDKYSVNTIWQYREPPAAIGKHEAENGWSWTAAVRQSDLYDSGDVFGVDASSIACVGALDPEPCDHVLEICCAPGTKLCCLADLCTVTGVDINRQRLTVARSQEHMPWLSEAKRTELAQLQFELLCRGFQLLKEGGKLIYCTCSFSEAQNEEVIRRFLAQEPRAQMDPLPWEMPENPVERFPANPARISWVESLP